MAAAKKGTTRRATKRAKPNRPPAPREPKTNPLTGSDDPRAPKLTDEQRQFVVCAIACSDSPSEIVAALKEQYGVEITRQSVEFYDPRKNHKLSKQWKDLHDAAREAFLKEVTRVPIAERAYRLRRLQRLLEKTEARGNVPLAAALLKQAAEEVGGKYTNKLEHSGIPAMPTAVTVTLVRAGERRT